MLSGEDQFIQPALGLTASSLLELELDRHGIPQLWTTGIKSLDTALPAVLWSSGKVVGIASEGSPLAEHIIATHLATLTPSSPADSVSETTDETIFPTTLIIAPPHTTIASTVHKLLTTSSVASASLRLLETVQILRYFDVAGLTESLSEVDARLHPIQCASDACPGTAGRSRTRTILYIDGLGPALESVQRRSGSVQANALAVSLLRSITHLSRLHSALLVVLNLPTKQDGRGDDEVTSAFSQTGRSACGQSLSRGGMLGRMIADGVDTMVLVHGAVDPSASDGDHIVEVVKDRVGGCLGAWAVWRDKEDHGWH